MLRRPSRNALYERLLEEKDAQLALLTEEIDYLRATRGQPSLPRALAPPKSTATPEGVDAVLGDGDWLSEDEEAKKIVEDLGLSAVHLPEILEGLGIGTSDLS